MPWNLVAAESHEGKDRPMQCQATVKISEGKKGKPMVLLSAPTVVFSPSSEAKVVIGDETRRLEVTVRSLPDKTPMTHSIAVKVTRTPEGEKPVLLATPTMYLTDGTTGKIRVEGSAVLEIEATVEPVK
jgi:hypothetical protein